MTTICIVSSFRYTHVIYSIEMDVSTDEFNSRNLTLNKRWNLSRCAKLALRAIWTHGLIAQLVRASERNSVVLDWNPTQAEFLFTATSKNPSVVNTIYIYICIYITISPLARFIKQMEQVGFLFLLTFWRTTLNFWPVELIGEGYNCRETFSC